MMDELGGSRLDSSLGTTIRKKRSQSLRRPRPEAHTQVLPQLYHDSHDLSPSSPIPVSDDFSRLSSDENTEDANSNEKIFNLNQCISRCPSANMSDDDFPSKKIFKNGALVGDASPGDGADHGHDGPSRNTGKTVSGMGSEKNLKKVKLKVGGVTRTIQAKQSSNGPSTSSATSSGSSAKLARSSDAPRSRQKLSFQENPDGDHAPSKKKVGAQGISGKDFSKGSLTHRKEDRNLAGKDSSEKQSDKTDAVRKSRRLPKKRVLDGAFDEDDDDEIRYLAKLKTSRLVFKDFEEESSMKKGNLSKSGKYENMQGNRGLGKDGKRSRSEKGDEDTDYEEDKVLSDCDSAEKKKKQKKDVSTSPTESKREGALTTRQRALLSNSSGASQIEFPNGLPPAPPRKQKEKLTEVEQQLKKAEAAQKRRIQNEKAAKESEAEAIRKILGQDSSRKKKEDKMKKRQEELAQEKAAVAQMNASSTIRLVMGPNGTVVTFPKEMGLPKIFEKEVRSYPPPREKCVGPLCTNPYKYRDSKSKLPLCSLQCYKAIQSKVQTETAC